MRDVVAGATRMTTSASTPPNSAAARWAWVIFWRGARTSEASNARVSATFCGIRYVSDSPPAPKVTSALTASAHQALLAVRTQPRRNVARTSGSRYVSMPVCQYRDWGRSGAVWSVASAATSASATAPSAFSRNCRNVHDSVASQTRMATSGNAGTMTGPASSTRLTTNVKA
jgi:hypothetical protein